MVSAAGAASVRAPASQGRPLDDRALLNAKWHSAVVMGLIHYLYIKVEPMVSTAGAVSVRAPASQGRPPDDRALLNAEWHSAVVMGLFH